LSSSGLSLTFYRLFLSFGIVDAGEKFVNDLFFDNSESLNIAHYFREYKKITANSQVYDIFKYLYPSSMQ
jgi:hypothetical protein